MAENTAAKTAKKKAPAKAAPKAKAKAKVEKAKDIIADTAAFVENLTKDSAYELVLNMDNEAAFFQFKLGGALSVIQSNEWYKETNENFREFVEVEFGIKYRKAMYLIAIYNNLVESGVEYEKVKALGWTKLSVISGIITQENVDDWVKAAKEMTVLELKEYIKDQEKGSVAAGGEPPAKGEGSTTKTVSTLTFKLHADQREVVDEAIEKAKNDADTEYPTVALEAICMSYVNQTTKVVKGGKDLKAQMEEAGWKGVLEVFEELWPEIDVAVKA